MNLSEFVARGEDISFRDAVHMILPIYMNAHNWNIDDSLADVYQRKYKHITDFVLINCIKNKSIIGKVIYTELSDNDGDPLIHPATGDIWTELNTYESSVNLKSLIEFIIKDLQDASYVPNELRELVEENDLPDNNLNLESKYDPKTDRLVCQGIARTLWDIYPNMTLKDLANHKAIQIYGNGKQYKDPKTLPGWLSEVDQRPEDKRRGPKKKN
jgi:hypothetical protein